MEEDTLFMLCDPKKCRTKKQLDMKSYLNTYTQHQNELLKSNNDNNKETPVIENNIDNNIINNSKKEELPECMIKVVNHINEIDEFILNNNYDKNMEKINDYLIDLLFLIKSKKK